MVSSISEMGTTIQNQSRLRSLRAQLDILQNQVSSGKKADIFGGLGVDSSRSISLRSHRSRLESYQSAISTVKPRTDAMDQNLNSINDMARDVLKSLQGSIPTDSNKMGLMSQQAKLALTEIMQRLNSKVDGRYIFSGDQVTTAPFADLNTVLTNVNALVDAYQTGTAAATVITSIGATTAADLGYTAGVVTAGNVQVRADDGFDVNYTMKADMEPLREMIRSLATIASLEYDSTKQADFEAIYRDATTSLDAATRSVDTELGKFGTTRKLLDNMDKQHDDTMLTIEKGIADIEDVDSARAISDFQALQFQMEASYKVIAQLKGMTLVNFI